MEYVVGTPRSRALRVLLAVVIALGLVPALSVTQAFAAEPKFIGTVYYPVAYDDQGYPLYNEDGSFQRDKPYVAIHNVENASGTLVIPETFDVVELKEDGTEKAILKDVTPAMLYIGGTYSQVGGMGESSWKNDTITALDLTHCASLESVTLERLPRVESVNLNGLTSLENITISRCGVLKTMASEGCSGIQFFSVSNCPNITFPDFSQPQWSGLVRLGIYSQTGLKSFKASLPELVDLSIQDTDLASVDVSGCAKLESLNLGHNQLTELDVKSIPTSVKNCFCSGNNIADTAALVERFGEDHVLPQGGTSHSDARLEVVSKNDASGILLPGQSLQSSLTYTYHAYGEVENNYNQEDPIKRSDAANFTAFSSDSSIATVELEKGDSGSYLVVKALKAGTTTLEITYSFKGDLGTYEAQQIIDFTVVANANPITSLSCAPSFDVPYITKCAIDGLNHTNEFYGGAFFPIEITKRYPDRLPTQSTYIQVESSDPGIVEGGYQIVTYGGTEVEYGLSLKPRSIGSAEVTLTAYTTWEDGSYSKSSEPVTVKVNVVEPKNPTLTILDEYKTTLNSGSIPIVMPPSPSGIPTSSLASYVEDETLALYKEWHGYGFTQGGSTNVDGKNKQIVTATSDNESVVSVIANGYSTYLNIVGPGTAHVTISDVWGNRGTCAVTVSAPADPLAEISKLSLAQDELTIKVGESFDLSTLVKGMDKVDPPFANMSGWLVFKSSNGYIAPIKWNLDGDYNDNLPHYVSQMLGRNVGDVTISANVQTGNDMGGSLEDIDKWEVAQFGTLTVHVVENTVEPNPATSVEVTGASDQVVMGSTLQLSAAITPANADNADELAWSSSDEAVATVDASGKVSPVAPGKATITATVGDVSGTFEVTVVVKAVPSTAVEVSAAKTAMKAGETQQLMATVTPKDTTDALVWSSSDEKVLAVDQSGLVTAVGNGTAAITATAGEVSDKTEDITVTTSATGVTLDATALDLFAGGDAATLKATVAPATASNKEVTWASSDESVATVDAEGTVSPVAAGTATITATTADGGFKAACTVTVKQHATGLKLNMNEVVITGADTVQLKATVEPDNATNKNVTWTSSDSSVATVDANGVVTSVAKGTATITATSEDGSFTDACAVTVTNPATSIAVDPITLNLIKGETAKVSAALSGALPGAVDELAVTWETSDSAVATVDGGAIVALKSGSATITAKAGALSAACTVKVTNPVKAAAISETSKTVTVGDEPFALTATVDPVDADDTTITWTSSNPKVATVDEQGNVTIKTAGTASIVASAGGVSASCALTVDAKVVAETPASSGFGASVSATDSETAQTLETLKNDGGLNLVMDAIEELTESAKGAIDKLTAAGETVAEMFDIHFAKDNGDEVVLSAKDGEVMLTVKVRLTDSMRALLDQGMELKVSYVGDDGTIEEKETWVEGDFLYFVTSHFSDYVVTGVPKPVGGEGDGVQGQTPGEDTGNPPLVKTDGGDTGSKLAPTGDPLTAAPIVLGTFACIAAGAVVLSRRKVR